MARRATTECSSRRARAKLNDHSDHSGPAQRIVFSSVPHAESSCCHSPVRPKTAVCGAGGGAGRDGSGRQRVVERMSRWPGRGGNVEDVLRAMIDQLLLCAVDGMAAVMWQVQIKRAQPADDPLAVPLVL
ncbi:hypothetical protein FGB62_128g117 [Gracilaria domingensis]|nr:hypothetical protein FGB62_128g117 [Gracilaria domingensis]